MTNTTPSPAAELRAAAARLRKLAVSMAEQHPGPWQIHNPNGYPQAVFSSATDVILCETLDEIDEPKPSAAYIAAMHPGVGLALAELLETAAEYVAEDAVTHPTHLVHALAVARALTA